MITEIIREVRKRLITQGQELQTAIELQENSDKIFHQLLILMK